MRQIAEILQPAIACGLLVGLLAPAAIRAQGVAQCNRCHGDANFMVGKGGSAAADSALYVPAARLAETAHGGIGCAACHAGYDQRYPHAPNPSALAPEQLVRFESPVGGLWVRSCSDCHAQVLEDVAASVPGWPDWPGRRGPACARGERRAARRGTRLDAQTLSTVTS